MLISLCQSLVSISRRTNQASAVVAVTSTIPISVNPELNCPLNFVFSVSQTGEITITGTLNGSPQTETVSVSSNKIGSGIKLFSTVTSVALDAAIVSGGGTVKIKFIGKDGGSVASNSTVASDYPLRVNRGNENLLVPQSGSNPVEKASALLPYTEVFDPKEGDIITLNQTGVQFLVTGNPFIEQVGFNSYWMLNLQKYENK